VLCRWWNWRWGRCTRPATAMRKGKSCTLGVSKASVNVQETMSARQLCPVFQRDVFNGQRSWRVEGQAPSRRPWGGPTGPKLLSPFRHRLDPAKASHLFHPDVIQGHGEFYRPPRFLTFLPPKTALWIREIPRCKHLFALCSRPIFYS
jgi:hypothetical protein